MITKQKIKSLIVIFSVMFVLTLTCVFHATIHPFFIKLFANRFDIVSSKNNLMVHFISVGQADASAINLPDGKVMLIDTGCEDLNTTYVNYIKENVLNSKMDDYIDYLVLSHADMDHNGGTIKLLQNFKIGTVFLPKVESNSQGYTKILNYVKNNCNYKILSEFFEINTELYKITFFEILNETNTNDSSQVVKVQSGNKSFLFMGDVSSTIDKLYVEKYKEDLDVDVLKVAHHGSNSGTSEELIKTTSPKYAVISVGFGNNYGHPGYETLERLKQNNIKILRTDEKDDILFVVGNDYDLLQKDGVFYIFNLSLDYVNIVIIVDGLLIVLSVVIILKKEKTKR